MNVNNGTMNQTVNVATGKASIFLAHIFYVLKSALFSTHMGIE